MICISEHGIKCAMSKNLFGTKVVSLGQLEMRYRRERSGRVLDSRPRGRGFEPHWRHCVVVLESLTLWVVCIGSPPYFFYEFSFISFFY